MRPPSTRRNRSLRVGHSLGGEAGMGSLGSNVLGSMAQVGGEHAIAHNRYGEADTSLLGGLITMAGGIVRGVGGYQKEQQIERNQRFKNGTQTDADLESLAQQEGVETSPNDFANQESRKALLGYIFAGAAYRETNGDNRAGFENAGGSEGSLVRNSRVTKDLINKIKTGSLANADAAIREAIANGIDVTEALNYRKLAVQYAAIKKSGAAPQLLTIGQLAKMHGDAKPGTFWGGFAQMEDDGFARSAKMDVYHSASCQYEQALKKFASENSNVYKYTPGGLEYADPKPGMPVLRPGTLSAVDIMRSSRNMYDSNRSVNQTAGINAGFGAMFPMLAWSSPETIQMTNNLTVDAAFGRMGYSMGMKIAGRLAPFMSPAASATRKFLASPAHWSGVYASGWNTLSYFAGKNKYNESPTWQGGVSAAVSGYGMGFFGAKLAGNPALVRNYWSKGTQIAASFGYGTVAGGGSDALGQLYESQFDPGWNPDESFSGIRVIGNALGTGTGAMFGPMGAKFNNPKTMEFFFANSIGKYGSFIGSMTKDYQWGL